MEKIIIYTDGGSKGNPGPSGIGVFISNEKNETIKKYSQYLGDNFTNNEAEYQAVIFALKKIKAIFGKNKIKNLEIEVRADSEFLVSQLNGEYKILDLKIQPLFIAVWNLKIDFKKIKFVFIGREKNTQAHRLAEEALNEKFFSQKLF
jgi:ribonuclease HI